MPFELENKAFIRPDPFENPVPIKKAVIKDGNLRFAFEIPFSI
jgi:hypothetical protein